MKNFRNIKNIKKILVIRTDRVGDFLLNIPVIKTLRQNFSQSYLAVMVNSKVSEIIEKDPCIDEIIVYNGNIQHRGFCRTVRFIKRLREKKFDLAIILNPTKKFNLITFLAGISHRVGYNRKWGFLLTRKIKDRKFLGERHEVDYNLDLVRLLGINPENKEISITLTKEDENFVKNLLDTSGIKKEDALIALHPWTTNPAKKWPLGNFLEVGRRLTSELNAKIAVIGGKEERREAESFCQREKKFINFSNQFNWRQLAAFLKRCYLLISNDSGPVHIASAVKTPCVVIFGRNIPAVGPKRWGPLGDGHIVLHKDPGCNPCLDRKCSYNFKCLTAITPEEVFKATETQLKKFQNLES